MGKHRKPPTGRSFGDGKGPGYKNISPKHQWKKGGPSPHPEGRPRKAKPEGVDAVLADLEAFLGSSIIANGPQGPSEVEVWKSAMQRLGVEAMNDGKMGYKLLKLRLDFALATAGKARIEQEDWREEDEAILRANEAKLTRRLQRRVEDEIKGGDAEDGSAEHE